MSNLKISKNDLSTDRNGYFTSPFVRAPLVVAIAMAVAGVSSVHAQDAGGADQSKPQIEEVTVEGIRQSLVDAQEAKRLSSVVVDSITSEDIGKYTDDNLAETLQRIPGVQISRTDNGEGQSVSIRGLGPKFVRSTVNGRSAFGGAGGDGGLDNQRSFGLDAVSPEMSAGVTVYKSVSANLTEGGIGGTVDIKTARPLDIKAGSKDYEDGFFFAVNAEGAYSENPDVVDPRASIFGSWKVDETFGVLVSYAQSERTTLTQISRMVGTKVNDVQGPDGTLSNVLHPNQNIFQVNDGDLEKQGLAVSLQWKPSDDWDVVFDYLKNDQVEDRFQSGLVLATKGDGSELMDVVSVATPQFPDVDSVYQSGTMLTKRKNALKVKPTHTVYDRQDTFYGFNSTWDPVDGPLAISVDVSHIETGFDRDNNIPNYVVDGANAFTWDVNSESDILLFGIESDPVTGEPFDIVNPSLSRDASIGFNRINTGGQETAAKFDFTYRLDSNLMSSVQWGVSYREREQEQIRNVFRYNLKAQDAILAEAGLTPDDIPEIPYREVPVPSDGLFNEVGSIPIDRFVGVDAAEVMAFWKPLIEQSSYAPEGGVDRRQPDLSGDNSGGYFESNEEISAAYLMANFDNDIDGMVVRGNYGVRVVETAVSGQGISVVNNPLTDTSSMDVSSTEGKYIDVLPSGNITISPIESVQVRLAASKVVSRPDPSDIAGPSNINFITEGGGATGSAEVLDRIVINRKNPDLDPFEAYQYDLIAEWYPGDEGAFVAAGYFQKDIKSLITVDSSSLDSFDFEGTTYTSDDELEIELTQPVNTEEGALVSGVELQGHLPFDAILPASFAENWYTDMLLNVGVSGSYTRLLENETDIVDPVTGRTLPFPGASEDNYSLMAYYKQGRFSSRLSYIYRSENFDSVGTNGIAVMNETYEALNANIGYNFGSLSVRLQARNILEEPVRQSTADGLLPYKYAQNGRSYVLGLRYKF